MELTYPSDTFPGPPSVRMTFPDTWVARPAASAIISAVDRDGPTDFGTNVVVIVSRILNDWMRNKLVSRLAGYYCLENRAALEAEAEM